MGRRASIIIDAVDKASPTFRRLHGTMGALGVAAAALGVVAFGRKLVRGMAAATEAAGVQQAAEVKLEQALVNAGQAVDTVLPNMKAYAAGLQAASTAGDEVILSNQALLVSYGATGELLEKMTQAAVDYAAGAGVSLENAFKNIGKTLGGLTGELGETIPALKNLTKEQLMAGEAADVILDLYGGQAAAQLDTYAGQVTALSNDFGDLAEAIGGPMMEVGQELIEHFLRPLIQDLTGATQDTETFRTLVIDLAIALVGLLRPIEAIANNFEKMLTAASLASKGFSGQIAALGVLSSGFDLSTEKANALELALLRLYETSGKAGDTVGPKIPVEPKIEDPEAATEMVLQAMLDVLPEGGLPIAVIPKAPEDLSDQKWFKDWLKWEDYLSDKAMANAKARGKADKAAGEVGVAAMGEMAAAAGSLFGDNKAIAIAQAIINTYEGASKALAQGGIFGIAAMAAVIAAGFAQVQKIKSTNPQGYAAGGMVRGNPAAGDSVHAMLTPGELVLNRDQQRDLVAGKAEGTNIMVEIGPNLRRLTDQVSVEVQRGGARLVATELVAPRYRRE